MRRGSACHAMNAAQSSEPCAIWLLFELKNSMEANADNNDVIQLK